MKKRIQKLPDSELDVMLASARTICFGTSIFSPAAGDGNLTGMRRNTETNSQIRYFHLEEYFLSSSLDTASTIKMMKADKTFTLIMCSINSAIDYSPFRSSSFRNSSSSCISSS